MTGADYRCGYACIIGRPNVGKSTLINRLLGQKLSITSRKPQTTRWRLLGIRTTDNYQVVYVDTPGLQTRKHTAITQHMAREIRDALEHVNVLLFVVEFKKWTAAEDKLLESAAQKAVPVILLINKIDRLDNKRDLLPFIKEVSARFIFSEVIPVSAKSGENTEKIEPAIVPYLPAAPAEFPPDQLSDRNERFFAAEFVREQLTRVLGDELPYRISVTVDRFETRPSHLDIETSIWVETEHQKRIVVGREGNVLKKVGTRAREEMERMFGHKVLLHTRARTRRKWSTDNKALKEFGYQQ